MSKQDLSKVLGRAMLDKEFAASLRKDPAAAAKSMRARLTAQELSAVKDISLTQFKSVSDVLRNKLGEAAFFDQQQVQQQARMD
ncbi:MAG TPA: Os1348 family NHLP clan protein [Allosphingosinicella sp.]|nr:Os1348 family NHLP clan protein [Allosphingosinicella sp.]